MTNPLQPVRPGSARLLPGLFQQRFDLNRKYMLALKTENLLQNFYMEAGLWGPRNRVDDHSLGVGITDLPVARPFSGPLAFGCGPYGRQHRRSGNQG